jgi:hypothetical protein
MLKILRKLGLEEIYLNIIKVIYDKTVASIMFNREKLEPFAQKSERRQWVPLSPFLFNIVLEFLASAKRKKKK